LVRQIVQDGLDAALQANPALTRGVATRNGRIVNTALAEAMNA